MKNSTRANSPIRHPGISHLQRAIGSRQKQCVDSRCRAPSACRFAVAALGRLLRRKPVRFGYTLETPPVYQFANTLLQTLSEPIRSEPP
jgi:hypothetical protein